MNEIDKTRILEDILKDVSSVETEETQKSKDATTEDEIIELGNDFDFDGFQVVRREFFAHLHEPSLTLNNCKFYVNSACLQRFPDTTSIQVLVNQDTKILAILPCPEGAKDSFSWCNNSKGKRVPKQVTCKLFFAKIVDLMKWNPDYKYKLMGKLIHANGETLIAFDLKATEVYQRTFREGAKPKTSRIPVFPAEWQNQFGLPYNEHKQSMQIDIFDGYAVYSIKDSSKKDSKNKQEEAADTGTAAVEIITVPEMEGNVHA